LEGRLRTDPSNADNWLLLARTTSMLGDWDKAADAYRQALRLGRKGADVYAALGEMLVLAAEGIVSPAAHDAFASAITTNPANDVARFYQALADSQAGDVRKAIDAWLALARDSPSDSPMREEIARQVAEAARSGGFEAPKLPPGRAAAAADDTQAGPTQDQMAAAAQMPPAERDKMIDGMIAQLAARLEAQPADADGWLRLGNAYAVRGKADKANDALERAIRLKPADPDVKLRAATSLLSGLQPSDPLPPRAIALLHDVAAARPDTPEALWYLGVAAAREGHPDAARLGWSRLLGLLAKDGEDAKMVQSALAQLKAP